MLRPSLLLLGLVAVAPARAQAPADTSRAGSVRADTVRADTTRPVRTYVGETLVVTGAREARALADVAVPTTVVTKEQIRAQGALRLSDLLAEQPGLVVLNALGGDGLQLQGFSPDYTLILVDGEPVVGRTAGTLDLSRLAVAGVERVEIVRGPSSSRYGSEALAGVVNIVTTRPGEALRGRLSARAESFGTYDLTAEGETGTERWGARVLANRLSSDGYDLSPDVPGRTSPAFAAYTAESRLRFDAGARTRLGLTARVQAEEQSVAVPLADGLYDQTGERSDWSVTPSLRHRFGTAWVLDASLHGARFANDDRTVSQTTGSVFDATSFVQHYGKAEASLGYVRNASYAAYAGGGWVGERVGGERYTDEKAAWQAFGFAEMQWMPSPRWDVNVSARVDAPSDYAARFSPKVAVLYKPSARARVRASVGSGYKAPAFRQRYLSFTNAAAGGYSVFGAEEVRARMQELQAAGGIAELLIPLDQLDRLRAENSVAFTGGVELPLGRRLALRADVFRHNVRDLIETQAVATKTNAQAIFSYFNVARIVSEGVEAELSWTPSSRLRASASYQFLRTYNRDVVDAIEAGTVYRRNAAGRDFLVARADYDGLLGRSPHSGTARVEVQVPNVDVLTSLRVVWRSAYGYRDADGNRVYYGSDEVAPGYALVHATASRAFGAARVQAGVRNLLGTTDAERLPGQAGRALFLGASYDF